MLVLNKTTAFEVSIYRHRTPDGVRPSILLWAINIALLSECGISGNLNILPLSGSRVPFAMAAQKQLPSIVSRVHPKFSTPYIAILFTALVMLFLTLKSSFVAALTISAIARLVTYAATCLALPVLRRNPDAPEAQFHLPLGAFIAVLSLVLIVWIVSNSTAQEAKVAAIVAVAGLLIYLGYKLYSRSS